MSKFVAMGLTWRWSINRSGGLWRIVFTSRAATLETQLPGSYDAAYKLVKSNIKAMRSCPSLGMYEDYLRAVAGDKLNVQHEWLPEH